jgi:hypothetical protein
VHRLPSTPAAHDRPADSSAALTTGELLPWEIADALWLMSVRDERPAPPPPVPPPPDGSDEPSTPPTTSSGPSPAPDDPPAQPGTPDPVAGYTPDTRAFPTAQPPPPADRPPPTPTHLAIPVNDSRAILRALRPLKRRVRSHRNADPVLDEEATAEQFAHEGVFWPITTPATERQLSLTLIIDDGPSMALWRPRITTFTTLLQQSGAFHTIKTHLLDTTGSTPVLRGATPTSPTRTGTQPPDPTHRHALLVLTDGIAGAWRQGHLDPLLTQWAHTHPTTIINLLPQRLWPRLSPAIAHARLTIPHPAQPNHRWECHLTDAWLDPTLTASPHNVPIPILELHPRWLRWWTHLLTGTHHPLAATVYLATTTPTASRRPPVHEPDLTPRELVDQFRGMASTPAYHLATLLAAVPINLPIAHYLQQHLLPHSGPEHLAEVLTSGLLRPTTDSTYHLPDPIREQLLAGARRSETTKTIHLAANRFGNRISVLTRLRDAITAPDVTPDPGPATNPADRHLETIVLRALSGSSYLSRADRLVHSSQDPKESEPTTGKDPANTGTLPSVEEHKERTNLPAIDAASVRAVEADPVSPGQVTGSDTFLDSSSSSVSSYSIGPLRERRPDEPPLIWGNVPPRNVNFTGRTELLDLLHKQLTAGGVTAVLPAAIHGMGGIGKTQTAVEYVYRHLSDYDIIWWIPAAHPTQVRAGLTELARRLRLPGGDEANTAVPAVREALRLGQPSRRWLLVFDAAENPDALRPFFPSNGPGEILITSRNPDWAGMARPLEVPVFKREESIALLRLRGPSSISDADANKVAEKLGDLPLAVEQAAAWLSETGMPVSEYLRLFDEKVAEILDTSTPDHYELSTTAAWNVSFDALRERNFAAHQILQICAFFAPEPIPRDLFSGSRGVTISPELDALLRDPIRLARAIRDINRYGLAKLDHSNNTIQLHRLVQLLLRDRMSPPQLKAQMLHGAHQLLANIDPNDPESDRHWPRYREILPHAFAAEVVNCDDDWVRQLVINLMIYLFRSGDHEEATRLAQRAHADFTEKLGPTHLQTLEVAGQLGLYLWAVGRFKEAAELNQKTLQLRIEVSGENSEETLGVQANIVTDLRAQGDFAEARKLSEEIYQKTKKLLGQDDPETLSAAFQHALSLRLSGEYHAAAELDMDTYGRRVEILSYEHQRTFSSYAAMIVDRREAGEYGWARTEAEKYAQQLRQRGGEDQVDTWVGLFLLSVARRKDGDHTGALELSGPATNQLNLRYGPSHAITVACVMAYSIDLRHSGNLAEARRLGEDAFNRYRQNFGEHHPHTLAAMVDLAVTLRLVGNAASARELDERALEQLRATVGSDHPYAIVAAINLASDLAALNEPGAALSLGTETVDRAHRVLGSEHPTSLALALNRSLDLQATGQDRDAVPLYTETLSSYRKVLGELHPGTQAAAKNTRADCDIDPLLM